MGMRRVEPGDKSSARQLMSSTRRTGTLVLLPSGAADADVEAACADAAGHICRHVCNGCRLRCVRDIGSRDRGSQGDEGRGEESDESEGTHGLDFAGSGFRGYTKGEIGRYRRLRGSRRARGFVKNGKRRDAERERGEDVTL